VRHGRHDVVSRAVSAGTLSAGFWAGGEVKYCLAEIH
jgi:hypothetical protein